MSADLREPALVAECSYQPRLSLNQAQQLRTHPHWSNGEFATIFLTAQRLCLATMDVPFSVGG